VDWLQIITLALIQGITEFLPISSSAHLILPSLLTDWPDQGLAFDVAVHMGTLAAVVTFFRDDLAAFTRGCIDTLADRRMNPESEQVAKLAAATLPVVVLGVLLQGWIESSLRSVEVIATTTILFGLLLAAADRRHGETDVVSWRAAMIIGTCQALALIPGTSRSGITITAGLWLGLSRTSAARFSFLLAIPTIAGAALLMLLELATGSAPVNWTALAAGAGIAGISAYFCISAFVRLVERTGVMPYVYYRLLLGTALFAFAALGW
jgi:undecaprenyl-diphosphatase